MKIFIKALTLISLASPFTSSSLLAASFQPPKAGEWTIETLESSLGLATAAIKTKPICIQDKDVKQNFETTMRDYLKKSQLDCNLKMLKEEAASIAYHVDCTATEAAKGKNAAMPIGSKVDGTMTMTRVSDTVYLLDNDSKATGLKIPSVDLSKVPEAQRKMLEGMMGMQNGAMNLKMKQRYTFAKAVCSKDAAKTPEASPPAATPATSAPAPSPASTPVAPVAK